MTGPGTNTYILGQDQVLIVDPGPAVESHINKILSQVAGAKVMGVFVTHAHIDHCECAQDVAHRLSAPTMASGPAHFGRSDVMQHLSNLNQLGGGEGVDHSFTPDVVVHDGQALPLDGHTLTALHTPGHFCNHMSLACGDKLLVGDHAMAWSTTLISPPDGDLGAFLRTCDRLMQRPETQYLPGHGDAIPNGPKRLAELVAHRHMRTNQILEALTDAPATAAALANRIYTDIPPALIPAATRNVLAHLIDLYEKGAVQPLGDISNTTKFQKT